MGCETQPACSLPVQSPPTCRRVFISMKKCSPVSASTMNSTVPALTYPTAEGTRGGGGGGGHCGGALWGALRGGGGVGACGAATRGLAGQRAGRARVCKQAGWLAVARGLVLRTGARARTPWRGWRLQLPCRLAAASLAASLSLRKGSWLVGQAPGPSSPALALGPSPRSPDQISRPTDHGPRSPAAARTCPGGRHRRPPQLLSELWADARGRRLLNDLHSSGRGRWRWGGPLALGRADGAGEGRWQWEAACSARHGEVRRPRPHTQRRRVSQRSTPQHGRSSRHSTACHSAARQQ
jgi:hypothetical protein